jgi:hypothetical protein
VKKLAAVLGACVTLAGVVAASALAADNVRNSGSYSYVDYGTCVDPIQIDGTYDQVLHSFYDSAGNATRFSFTGKVTVTYTNLTTGATYSANASGPGTIDLATDQTILRGGTGGMFDSSGNFVATDGRLVLDSHGNIISIVGHSTDVCSKVGSARAS